MRAVIQRVKEARVDVDAKAVGEISTGLLVFLGVHKDDTEKDADYLAQKILQLRIFEDAQGKMNVSAEETKAGILVVSQFTLYGDYAKGRRPSFDAAAEPQKAEDLYNYFIAKLKSSGLKIEQGRFKAMMDVSLVNDGPVTFILERGKR